VGDDVSIQVIRWGVPLTEAEYQEGDLLKTLAQAVMERFDPYEGLAIEMWSSG
jgi:hypothetical protein